MKKRTKKIANLSFWIGYIILAFGGVQNMFYFVTKEFQPNIGMGLVVFAWLSMTVYALIKEFGK